jgi:hypothetical protein
MSFGDIVKKELYVAVHGQTARFRIVKYIVLFAVFSALYSWYGWKVVWQTLGVALIAALVVHFFFRFKTNGWSEPWGLYKPPTGLPK